MWSDIGSLVKKKLIISNIYFSNKLTWGTIKFDIQHNNTPLFIVDKHGAGEKLRHI